MSQKGRRSPRIAQLAPFRQEGCGHMRKGNGRERESKKGLTWGSPSRGKQGSIVRQAQRRATPSRALLASFGPQNLGQGGPSRAARRAARARQRRRRRHPPNRKSAAREKAALPDRRRMGLAARFRNNLPLEEPLAALATPPPGLQPTRSGV